MEFKSLIKLAKSVSHCWGLRGEQVWFSGRVKMQGASGLGYSAPLLHTFSTNPSKSHHFWASLPFIKWEQKCFLLAEFASLIYRDYRSRRTLTNLEHTTVHSCYFKLFSYLGQDSPLWDSCMWWT